MAISVVGTPQTGQNNNGGDVTLTFDVAPSEGDVVVVFGGHGDAVTTLTAPESSASAADYTQIAVHTGSAPIFGAWYKVQGASPDSSVICYGSGNNSDGTGYCCYVLTGVDSSVLDQTTTTAGPTTSTNPDPPSITTQTDGAWVIAMAGSAVFDNDVGTISGYSNLVQASRNETNDLTAAGATIEVSSAQAENPAAFDGWDSGTWYAITAAIKPEAAGDLTVTPTVGSLALNSHVPLYPKVPHTELHLVTLVGLQFRGQAPTVSVDSGLTPIVEEPGAGALQTDTTGTVPVRIVNHIVSPTTRAVEFDSDAISSEIDHFKTNDPDELQLNGVTPLVLVDDPTLMAVGELQLDSGAASSEIDHFKTNGSAALVFNSDAPTSQVDDPTDVPQANELELDSTAPSLNWSVLGTSGTLQFNSDAPTILVDVTVLPGAGELETASDVVSLNWSVLGAAGQLELNSDTQGRQVDDPTSVPADELQLDSDASSAEIDHFRSVGGDALEFNSDAPNIVVGALSQPTVGELEFDQTHQPSAEITHTRQVGAGSLVLTGIQPARIVNHIVNPGIDELSIGSDAPTISVQDDSVSTGSLSFSSDAVSPLINPASPGVASLTLTGETPIRAYGLQLIGQSVTISASAGPQTSFPDSGALTLTGQDIDLGRTRSPASDSLSLSSDAPSLNWQISAQVGSLALNGVAPTLNNSIIVSVGSLTLAGKQPRVSASVDPDRLVLTGQAPSLQIANSGTAIVNPDATTFVPTNYEQCDYTGFRQLPGSLKLTWNKYAVRRKSWEERHPSDYQKSHGGDKQEGPQRPEQDDRFIGDEIDEVEVDDL